MIAHTIAQHRDMHATLRIAGNSTSRSLAPSLQLPQRGIEHLLVAHYVL
jgi:hypothetical protein